MGIKRLLVSLFLISSSTAVFAGPITTYNVVTTPSWPSQPSWPTQATLPSVQSWPSAPTASIPTISGAHSYGGSYGRSYYSSSTPRLSNAQQQLENVLGMHDSPELVRSQQLQGQLQLEALRAQDSAFNAQRAQQEQLGAAPGIAAEETRRQQDNLLRAQNESLLQQWQSSSR